MLRILDLLLSMLSLILGLPLLLVIYIISLFDTGSPLFRQTRVGRDGRPFTLVKFRTMKPGTPSVATHLASRSAVTSFGRLLRHTKLDELPQVWNVLKGEMSFVGPRPCLSSQTELVQERNRRGVLRARPGITGLAQIKGIDMSTPSLLAETDAEMLASLGVREYFRYIYRTLIGAGSGDRIRP
ncbi:sugar transferase [Thioalkalivibrio sp.]|uniref:sugar transferase n=1 Tax=Thioalkalivibrio sp. TaxID=2093813 RepID=UPI003569EBDC